MMQLWSLLWLSLASFGSSFVVQLSKRPSSKSQLSVASISAPPATRTTTSVTLTVPPFATNCTADYPSLLHKIRVESFLTPEEAATCLRLANQYAGETGRWDRPDKARHETYSTCDFIIEECDSVAAYLDDIDFEDRMWQRLHEVFGIDYEDMTFLDFFCANYQAKGNDGLSKTMDRLEAHRDGSLLSFTVLLTPPTEFEGGGTFFDALRDEPPTNGVLYPGGVIRPSSAGECVLHSGKLLHGGDVITKGERTVLVGFVDIADWSIRQGGMAEACREFGRMDVAAFRYKNQQIITKNGKKRGWISRNDRWLPDTKNGRGRSHIRGVIPAFDSVRRRADPEYQRQKKLETEDKLLRTILLPEKSMDPSLFFDGNLTIM